MPQSQSTSLLKKQRMPAIAVKREAGFYKQMKEAAQRSSRKLLLTRIENSIGAGIPDVLLCDESGTFCFVELKFLTSNSVTLQPSQVAWLSRHQHSPSWILIKKQNKPMDDPELFLYPAAAAVDLKMDGLQAVEPLHHQKGQFNWDVVFNLICPT